MSKPCPFQAAIMEQLAFIKAAEKALSTATEYWGAAQSRFLKLVEDPAQSRKAIESGWLEAEAAYQSCLHAIKEKGDHVVAMQRLKARRAAAGKVASAKKPPKANA